MSAMTFTRLRILNAMTILFYVSILIDPNFSAISASAEPLDAITTTHHTLSQNLSKPQAENVSVHKRFVRYNLLDEENRLTANRKFADGHDTSSDEDEDDVDVDMMEMCDASETNNWFIYCKGRILESVNYHRLYEDSKEFVDKPLHKTQEDFDKLFLEKTPNEIGRAELQEFVNNYFLPSGSELISCTPSDFNVGVLPEKLKKVVDPQLRQWALELYNLWGELCKKVRSDIREEVDRYSLIYIENEFIAPGGRFREFYYWDAYWIVKGLMASEMYNTAKQMIRNLGSMVQRFGFIPNGGRVYYLRRSQPPLLTAMVYEYFESRARKQRDVNFLHEMLPILEKEIHFWDRRRRVGVLNVETHAHYRPYQYRAESNVPRPESFKEDVYTATGFNETERSRLYQHISSAAESGWDFSSRWMKGKGRGVSTIETVDIIPVDLNAFMCWNFDLIATLYLSAGNYTMFNRYRKRFMEMQDVVEQLFYNETTGAWHDYNLRTQLHNTNFYLSTALPLFARCYMGADQTKSERLFDYMADAGVFEYPFGVPTSLMKSSNEQWDFPNGWSPLNHMIIEGFRKSENPLMQQEGFRLAEKWVFGNYKVFLETRHMWEKYNVNSSSGRMGSGGEYEVQFGFGWSNGVILDLLNTYYDRLKWHDDMFDGPTSSPHLDDNRGHSGGSSGGDKNHGVRSALLPPTLLLLFVVATIRFMAEHHLRFLMKMDLPRSVSINKL